MKLILVRHGETIENKKKRVCGHNPGRLSSLGKQQVKKLGKRLKNEKIDVIYISDLKRTRDTAKEIIKFHKGTKIIFEPNLREVARGIYEGKPYELIERVRLKTKKSVLSFRPKGGESISDTKKRVRNFVKKVFKENKNKTVLFVTHGGPIMHVILHLLKKSDRHYKKYVTKNASVTILDVKENKKHKLELLNCTKHLN